MKLIHLYCCPLFLLLALCFVSCEEDDRPPEKEDDKVHPNFYTEVKAGEYDESYTYVELDPQVLFEIQWDSLNVLGHVEDSFDLDMDGAIDFACWLYTFNPENYVKHEDLYDLDPYRYFLWSSRGEYEVLQYKGYADYNGMNVWIKFANVFEEGERIIDLNKDDEGGGRPAYLWRENQPGVTPAGKLRDKTEGSYYLGIRSPGDKYGWIEIEMRGYETVLVKRMAIQK